jgi:branched-chain amino acid transport system permease protein
MNLAQGAFALVGGYAGAIFSTRYGVPFWFCLPLAGLISAILGALIGWPVLRLKGVYFAMTTLSLTEAIRLLALNGGDLTKGATGIVNIPRPGAIDIFGLTIVHDFNGADPLPFYFLACALLLLGLVGVWRLSTSRLGWVFRSLRQNEDLATSIGINVAKYRVIAFAVCCFMGGIGGAFFAAFHQNIYPATYTISDSVNFMLYCFLGGLSYIFGPVVGAFLLVVAFELLQAVQDYQALIYGILMIACMLWLPNGILSLGLRHDGKGKDGRG